MSKLAVVLVSLTLAAPGLAPAAEPAHSHAAAPAKASAAAAQDALRDLWIGHVFWVRNVAVATLGGDAAAAAAAEAQVVANAKQIAGAIEPFYGKPAADQLFGLLAGHYGAVKEYLDARDQPAQDAAWKRLGANASEIAAFLAGANPYLPVDTLRGLLVAHGGHHVQQIRQLRAKDYAGEAQTWHAMAQHMYVIADALAGAIARQFPAKFG